jgi:MFS family permease
LTETDAGVGARGALPAGVRTLAVAETLAWAGLYYSFPALLPHWERALGWSKTTLSGAFTLALVASAIGAPFAGRLIDRGYGRHLLAGSTLAGGVCFAGLAAVEQVWQFYLLWAGVGLAMAGALYEPCFAHLTHCFGAGARRAITTVTLVAGFAGTLSFPSAHLLAERFGWRGAVLGMAVVVCLVATPLVWHGARLGAAGSPGTPERRPAPASGGLGPVLRRPAFWLLAFAFALVALTHGVLVTHLLPLLGERGVAPGTAVLVASLIGPMQVLGRIVMLSFERRVSIDVVCAASFGCMMLGAALLYGVAALPLLAFVWVVVHGSGYGVTSITRPVVTAEHLGRAGFGAISGAQATLFMGASALAPTLAALLWESGGYDRVIVTCGFLAFGALASFLVATRQRRAG